MTEQAGVFYGEEARKLRIPVPDIFSGAAQSLMAEDQVLTTRTPGPVGDAVTASFREVLESVTPFIMYGFLAHALPYDQAVRASSERYIGGITGAMLLPQSVKSGTITGLSIEAIAPQELSPGMVTALGPASSNREVRDPTARRALLVVSGFLKRHGYVTTVPCAGIVGAYTSVRNRSRLPTPHFVTGALSLVAARQWHEAHS